MAGKKYPTISWDDERSESRMMSRVFWISHKSLVQRIPASSGNATSAWIFCTSDECEIFARHKSWVGYFRSLRRKVSALTFLIVPNMRKSEFTDFYTKDFKLKLEKWSNSYYTLTIHQESLQTSKSPIVAVKWNGVTSNLLFIAAKWSRVTFIQTYPKNLRLFLKNTF